MAMLAEPRQRKSYILQPRGKPLYEDDCRFGTKMLKKMGWSSDKGLGANENGTMDFIRVQYKHDMKGLSYEERDDQWTQHESGFNELLHTLNDVDDLAGHDSVDERKPARSGFGFSNAESKTKHNKGKLKEQFSGESLEQKSKHSKARVHYKKFTRGKDLTRYSEKDLANIFGKKGNVENDTFEQFRPITIPQNENGWNSDDAEASSKTAETGLALGHNRESAQPTMLVTSGVSVQDYFKLKMEALRNKVKTPDAPTVEDDYIPAVNGTEDAVNKPQKQKRPLDSEPEEAALSEAPPKKRRKNKRIFENEQIECSVKFVGSTAVQVENEHKPTKKRRREKNDVIEPENAHLEQGPQHSEDMLQPLPFELANQERTHQKKFKKARELTKSADDLQAVTVEENCMQPPEHVNKKKKKKQKSKPLDEPSPDAKSKIKKAGSKQDPSIVQEEARAGHPLNSPCAEAIRNNVNTVDAHSDKQHTQGAKVSGSRRTRHEQLKEAAGLKELAAQMQTPDELDSVLAMIQLEQGRQPPAQTNTACEIISVDAPQANTYLISTFCAEKFRNCDMEGFSGATLAGIDGYAFGPDTQIEVKQIVGDDKRITNMWTGINTKYLNKEPKYTYYKYSKQLRRARISKASRLPRLQTKAFKRLNKFTAL